MERSVLIIVENAPVPFDPRVWKEATSLLANQYQVIVLSPRAKCYDKRHELIDGIHVYRHPLPSERSDTVGYMTEYMCALFWESIYAWWIYLRHGFRVIQGCNPPDTIVLVALQFRLLNVRYIFDHHDANPELYLSKYENEGILYWLLVLLEQLTYRFSDVVLATNLSYQALATTRGRKDPADVFVVRNGPDLNTFERQPAVPALRHGKRYLVGYVGTMGTQDGLDILMNVALHVKKLGRHDIHFTCVGGGPALASLRKVVEDHDLEDMVNFTGRVPDNVLLDILSTADVCVNPDKPCEMNDISTMIKVMEYMALGKPIVQFDSREGRFSAAEASLYADKENQVQDFAAKILWLLDNPSERARMGWLGRKRVEDALAWKYSVPNLLAAYDRCFSRRSRSRSEMHRLLEQKLVDRAHNAECADSPQTTTQLLAQRFRCDGDLAHFVVDGNLSGHSGYFRMGPEAVCFGQCSSGTPAKLTTDRLHDAREHIVLNGSSVHLPFDPVQTVKNLCYERYTPTRTGIRAVPRSSILRNTYYFTRPFLGASLRQSVQRRYFKGWDQIPFPKWPVDLTVENIFEQLLMLTMQSSKVEKVPFIWFWPDGARSCTMMTHDVETAAGRDYCPQLMDLNDSFAIKSSFQIVPEGRYPVSQSFLQDVRKRSFEINVHDLNHDGCLMCNRKEFLRRAQRINFYGREFGALGFRSAVMYRNLNWYDALEFSYDMSVPNMAHLDPQQGGCCTVFPFFIGKILELPLTTTQDYSLFYILNQYSTALWRKQISRIRQKHGLVSFLVHPDYIMDRSARRVYEELLTYVAELRSAGETWTALPNEIAVWWRLRSQLHLVDVGGSWRIEGEGNRRARLAYAVIDDSGSLTYELAKDSETVASS